MIGGCVTVDPNAGSTTPFTWRFPYGGDDAGYVGRETEDGTQRETEDGTERTTETPL